MAGDSNNMSDKVLGKTVPYQCGRLMYIEPNDVYGKDKEGNPITPDYTDLCISVDIICERTSRMHLENANTGKNGKSVAVFTWNTKATKTNSNTSEDPNNNKSPYFSFLTGDTNTNSLTTYYTEISYDNIQRQAQIEGLGIESIDITFESWFTPTIKVRFVDVRGAALFDREESIHTNGIGYSDNMESRVTADSLFGCFMTIPYPRFRMQVKGFYGRGVTYQLTCTDFRGSYDGNTGNFIFDVTFVGYDYGMMCDIPMMYVYAAPFCRYGSGFNYWARQRETKEWELLNGEKPITLYELRNNIRSANLGEKKNTDNTEYEDYSNTEVKVSTTGNSARAAEYASLNDDVERLQRWLTAYDEALALVGNAINVEGKFTTDSMDDGEAFFLYTISGWSGHHKDAAYKGKTTLETDDGYEYDVPVYEWNNNFGKATSSTRTNYLRRLCKKARKTTLDNALESLYNIKTNITNYNKTHHDSIPETDSSTNEQKYTIGKKHALVTSKDVIWDNNKELFQKYFKDGKTVHVLSDNKFRVKTADLITQKKKRIAELEAADASETAAQSESPQDDIAPNPKEREQSIKELVGVTPYIGNVFKIILCHLETLLHVINECADIIDSQMKEGDRSMQKLGLQSLDDTDIATYGIDRTKDKQVCQFPGVTAFKIKGAIGESSEEDENIRYETWVGDYGFDGGQPVWEEEKLVHHMLIAMKKMSDSGDATGSGIFNPLPFPVIPSDLRYDGFNATAISSFDSLAGFLGLRAAAIFGVSYQDCSDGDANTIGRMDALNLAMEFTDAHLLSQFIDPLQEGDGASVCYGIAECSNDTDSYGRSDRNNDVTLHAHEVVDNMEGATDGRHRIFRNGKYVYTNTSTGGNSMVPINLSNYRDILGDEVSERSIMRVGGNENGHCVVKPMVSDYRGSGFLHVAKSRTLLIDDGGYNEKTAIRYKNSDMFDIILDDSDMQGGCRRSRVLEIYESLCSGVGKIANFEDGDLEGMKTGVADKIWAIEDSDYARYFGTQSGVLFPRQEYINKKINDGDSGIGKVYISSDSEDSDTENTRRYLPKSGTIEDKKWAVTTRILEKGEGLSSNVGKFRTTFDADSGGWRMNGEVMTINELTIRSPYIYTRTGDSSYTFSSLFGTRLYYMQNTNADDINSSIYNDKSYSKNDIKIYRKCILYLQTLRYDLSQKPLFTESNRGSITCIPYGYALLIGALLWRNRMYKATGKDVLLFNTEVQHPAVDETLFVKFGSSFLPVWNVANGSVSFISVKDIIDIDNIEPYVENVLIDKFEHFIVTEWKEIMNAMELRDTDGTELSDSKFYEITSKCFVNNDSTNPRAIVEEIKDSYKNLLGTYCSADYAAYSNGRDSIPVKYASISLTLYEDASINNTLKDIYTRKVLVLNSLGNGNTDGKVSVRRSTMMSYLNGFWKELNDIYGNSNKSVGNPSDRSGLITNEDRDFCISIYQHLKMIWDKWILFNRNEGNGCVTKRWIGSDGGLKIATGVPWYSVKNMMPNYIFIDSFYRNIFGVLHINCDILCDLLDGMAKDANLFNFLSNLTTKHHCLFMGLPDYIALGDATESTAMANLASLFVPLPYSQKNDMETSNKFVIMFVHPPSKVSGLIPNGYVGDSFDIFLEKGGRIAPVEGVDRMFSKDKNGNDGIGTVDNNIETLMTSQMTRYGYNIPSFGIALNRMNNHLFKNVTASMANPVTTDQSLIAFANVLERTRGNEKAVVFYGQDLFPTYSGNSYTIDVDMMGDAQIMPLMYCQLLNMPMFRGTYLIYKVTHRISPGDMTTRFSAMKMAKNAQPYAIGWFTKGIKDIYITKDQNIYYDNRCMSYKEEEEYLDTNSKTSDITVENLSRIGKNTTKPNSTELTNLSYMITEVIDVINKHLERPITKKNITSAWRDAGNNNGVGANGSQHLTGQALDIQYKAMPCEENLKIAQAIAAYVDFDQLILEGCPSRTEILPSVVHVSYVHPSKRTKDKGARRDILAYEGAYSKDKSSIPLSKEQLGVLGLTQSMCIV